MKHRRFFGKFCRGIPSPFVASLLTAKGYRVSSVKIQQPAQFAQTAFGYSAEFFLLCLLDRGAGQGNAGKHLATTPPYGYTKSAEDKEEWILDEVAAPIVADLFEMFKGDKTC